MQTPARFLFDEWSDCIKLYITCDFQITTSYAQLESKYVSKIHAISNFWAAI